MKSGFLAVHDFRLCTDFELQRVIEQAAVASYILQQRELIAAMIRDHGEACEKLLAQNRELQDRIAMLEALQQVSAAERVAIAGIACALDVQDGAVAVDVRDTHYEPVPEVR